ncbi:MAG: CPBP family intramembrane metalloprotease [Candidatus Zixiibacteriota bacterium]|nr:MAG: CPBP family intramembrane metalloprotease [candidate division Zixibacteria bacterium]
MEQDQFKRIEVYQVSPEDSDPLREFKSRFGIGQFRISVLTWVTLLFLILLYPAASGGLSEDPSAFLQDLNPGVRIILFAVTIVLQWSIFFLIWITTYREKTTLAGIGLKRLRSIDVAWAVAFLVASNLILTGIAWFLAQIGLPMPGEISLLIPEDTAGRVLWVGVSFTAGFCEEAAFRGYLMTRIRLVGRLMNWVIPAAVSSFAFGFCHAYQGLPGVILITCYGLLFALLYIRTGSLWPCVIAHSLQDLGALFFPQ